MTTEISYVYYKTPKAISKIEKNVHLSPMYPNSVEKSNKTIMNCFRDRNRSRKNLKEIQNYNEFIKHPLLPKSQQILIYRCDGKCVQKIQNLNRKVAFLEKLNLDDKFYKVNLQTKIMELTNKLEELQESKKIDTSPPPQYEPEIYSSSTKIGRTIRKLTNWCRPSIDTLKDNNIFQDEPCFDTELEMTLKHEVFTTVPKIVVECVDLIETKFKQSPHPIDGLYRVSGEYTKIQALRFSIDSNDYDSLKSVSYIHTLTGVLKLFLREIKHPLVNANEIRAFVGPSHKWLNLPAVQKIEILKNLVKTLPECNRDTMNYLFSHFHRLTKVPLQKVPSKVLALSITPTILHTASGEMQPKDILVVLRDTELFADCLQLMIDHSSKIFGLVSDYELTMYVADEKENAPI